MTAPADSTVRVLIDDDEPLGRLRLEDLLRDEPGIEIVGTAADGVQAVAAISAVQNAGVPFMCDEWGRVMAHT